MSKDGSDLLVKALRRAHTDLQDHREDLEQKPENEGVAADEDDDPAKASAHAKAPSDAR